MTMNKIRIENWSVCVSPHVDAYTPPEYITQHLQGAVTNHPKFGNIRNLVTSPIVGLVDGCIKVKSGKLYELGTIDPNYEKAYPNAHQRLFASFYEKGNIRHRG